MIREVLLKKDMVRSHCLDYILIDKYRTIQLAKKGFDENEDFEGELSAVIDELLLEK